ncbi:hypothetical protein PAHAL_5G052100 [Panicum hallii]|uniref:Uncharacterized protein n=1 Tax=Panicum hallii TaxID=206008 RepID=A0A2T8IIY8_9POAL|nr:hypothetical protein PAHAL_5G052100 [Panicum hallii]
MTGEPDAVSRLRDGPGPGPVRHSDAATTCVLRYRPKMPPETTGKLWASRRRGTAVTRRDSRSRERAGLARERARDRDRERGETGRQRRGEHDRGRENAVWTGGAGRSRGRNRGARSRTKLGLAARFRQAPAPPETTPPPPVPRAAAAPHPARCGRRGDETARPKAASGCAACRGCGPAGAARRRRHGASAPPGASRLGLRGGVGATDRLGTRGWVARLGGANRAGG